MALKNEILAGIDALKAELVEYRPFSDTFLPRIRDFYKVGLTYSSNAIEGISYTETETKILLEEGLTAGGKPMHEALAVIGHGKAYEYMFSLLHQNDIQSTDILAIHSLLEGGLAQGKAGAYRTEPVFVTGSTHVFPAASAVPRLMDQLDAWIKDEGEKLHPVELAAQVHLRLVSIHPFADGNGRTARLCMNTILIQNGYLPAIIPPVLRAEYIDSIKEAQSKKLENGFIVFIYRCVKESMKDMLRMLRGSAAPQKEHTPPAQGEE